MSVIAIVLPLALILASLAVAACWWALSSGQMDDMETPALRPLLDDDEQDPSE